MSQTTTLENVINTIHNMSLNHYDDTIPVQDMEFDSLSQMWVAGKPVEIAPSAQRLLANRLRVPYTYLERCPEDLQAQNLNFWIEQETRKRETFFCRFDNNRLRAVFTERYRPLDNMEILSQLIEGGFDSMAEVQYSVDETMFLIKIPEYSRAFSVNLSHEKQDRVVPGICISNSEVGILAFSIEAFFYRIVCTNGLISKTSTASRFKHISQKGLDNFHDTLRLVLQDSTHNQRQFQISRQSEVSNPISTIEMFARQFGLAEVETEMVRQAYYQEPGNSMFSVINAYTAAAKSPQLTTAEVFKLERAGGMILSLVKP
jgi:hypothetical protein